MKRIIASILIVITLCFSFGFNCYAEPVDIKEETVNTIVEKVSGKISELMSKEVDVSAPADNGIMYILCIAWCVLMFLLLIATLVFVVLRTAAILKSLKSVNRTLSSDEQERRLTQKLDLIENELMMVKSQINTLNSNIANSTPAASAQPVQPAAPVVELTFEEKVNNALNSGNMAEFGMRAVEIEYNGSIELKDATGSNILFYCQKSDDVTFNIYPDSKIKERMWEQRYSNWFDVIRNTDAGTIITLNNPLVIKFNSSSGRYDLMNKGKVTIF